MIFSIAPITTSILNKISTALNEKDKGACSLGDLEQIALKIAMIQNTEFPQLLKPTHYVILADQGVKSVFDLDHNLDKKLYALGNKSSVLDSFNTNEFLEIHIVNAGMTQVPQKKYTEFTDCTIKNGTRSYFETNAMTITDYETGIENGAKLSLQAAKAGSNCISFGTICKESELSASIVTSEITNTPIEDVLHLGTNYTKEKQEQTLKKLNKALALHNPLTLADFMCTYGGFDLVTIVGGMLKAAELNMSILVDGYVSAAALLFAYQLNENIFDYCIFCNEYKHKGHQIILDYFEKNTILNLDFESNIGLGVPLSLPIIKSSLLWLNSAIS